MHMYGAHTKVEFGQDFFFGFLVKNWFWMHFKQFWRFPDTKWRSDKIWPSGRATKQSENVLTKQFVLTKQSEIVQSTFLWESPGMVQNVFKTILIRKWSPEKKTVRISFITWALLLVPNKKEKPNDDKTFFMNSV